MPRAGRVGACDVPGFGVPVWCWWRNGPMLDALVRRTGERARTAHIALATRASHATQLALARAAPPWPVSDGRRRCSYGGVVAVWPCIIPPTWLRSQEYSSSFAESPSPRERERAAHPELSNRRHVPSDVADPTIGTEDYRVERTSIESPWQSSLARIE